MSNTAQNHWSPDNDTWCHSYPSPPVRTPEIKENLVKVVDHVLFTMKIEGKCHLKVKYTSPTFPDEFLPQDHKLIKDWMDTFVDMSKTN